MKSRSAEGAKTCPIVSLISPMREKSGAGAGAGIENRFSAEGNDSRRD